MAQQYLNDKRLVVSVTPRAKGRTAANEPVPESPAKAVGTQAQPGAATSATSSGGTTAAGAQVVTKTEARATTPAGATPPQADAPGGGEKKHNQMLGATNPNLPKPQADPTLRLPTLQRRKLSNGLEVLLVEHHELPVVSMNLVVKSGAAADPVSGAGLANTTAALLDEGTKTRNALAISDALTAIGARLNTGAGWDESTVDLVTLTRHLDHALDIYADVITNPAFDEAEFKRARATRLAQLQQQREDANAIAGVVYASLLYGREHPYGHPLGGNEASLTALTEADVRRFYETHYRPNNAALIVVGDVKAATLLPKLERAFAGWKRGRVPAAANVTAAPVTRDRSTIYLVDKPGAAQSVIQIGQVGVARSSPDYFPLLVLNSMLGGAFVSRVNLNLREDKGYTYGARTAFDYRRGPGPFTASAGVFTNVTKESVAEFMKELRGIRGERPVDAQELNYFKQSLIRSYPRGFETPGQIGARLVDLVLYGLPDDYFNNYIARVNAVTQADIERVANRYLDPGRMAILVVGDRKVVEPGLRSLNDVGTTITPLDTEGRPTTGDASGSSGGNNRP